MTRARTALEQIARQASRCPAWLIAAGVTNRATGTWPLAHLVLSSGDVAIVWTGTATYTATGSGTAQSPITLDDGSTLLLVINTIAGQTLTISRTSGSAVAAVYECADSLQRIVQVQGTQATAAPLLIVDVPEVERELIARNGRGASALVEALLLTQPDSGTDPAEDFLTAADLADRLMDDILVLGQSLGDSWQIVGDRIGGGIRQESTQHRRGEILTVLAWNLEAAG